MSSNKNHVETQWLGNMAFESSNPSGNSLIIDVDVSEGGGEEGYRPKALMLSSLAGCSGLDVASLIKKMKLDVEQFKIEIIAGLTDEHPKYYNEVLMEYHFFGNNLKEAKLQKAVDLSIEKYCGVSEMFRQFAEMEIKTIFHHS